MTNFIRQVRAFEGETVEIAWTCRDDSKFYQRLTIPPTATREAMTARLCTCGVLTGGTRDPSHACPVHGVTEAVKAGPST